MDKAKIANSIGDLHPKSVELSIQFVFRVEKVLRQFILVLLCLKKLNKNIKIYQMTVNPDAFKLDFSGVVQ